MLRLSLRVECMTLLGRLDVPKHAPLDVPSSVLLRVLCLYGLSQPAVAATAFRLRKEKKRATRGEASSRELMLHSNILGLRNQGAAGSETFQQRHAQQSYFARASILRPALCRLAFCMRRFLCSPSTPSFGSTTDWAKAPRAWT